MSAAPITTVRWGAPHSRDGLYGSDLRVSPHGDVTLRNPLMPSGTPMQEWYSFTDYQAQRVTPSLPLLQHGARYRLEPELATTPAGTAFFEARFFDRFDALLYAETLYPPGFRFDYPGDCHHYTIRLLNGGCSELHFVSFALWEVGANG